MFKINHRLLKYCMESYDYNKIKNKKYTSRFYYILLANYIWFEYKNLDLVTKCLLKYPKSKIFNIIDTSFNFLIPHYELNYNLNFSSSEKLRILKLRKEPYYCKHCNSRQNLDNMFCSVKCSNQFKAKDKSYLTNLSIAQKKYYENADNSKLIEKNIKIKESAIKYNSMLSIKERSKKYSNNTLIYDSFDNQNLKLSNIEFLFDSDFYYANKYLPVKCSICKFKWSMTKTTSISRTTCIKCNPPNKAKTQFEIFTYVNNIAECKLDDRSFLKNRKELDILCDEFKFAIEYDGLLYHSLGHSKYPKFGNAHIHKNYHLNKTTEVQEKGYQLFHIFENEWLDIKKQLIWKSIINNKFMNSLELNNIFYKDCVIKEVHDNLEKNKNKFLEENHLEGSVKSDINICLYFNNELIQIMTFNKLSGLNEHNYELTRFCTKINTNIFTYFNNFNNLLSYFETTYNPKSIIFNINKRWDYNFKMYEDSGFVFVNDTEPNYFYFKVNENILYPANIFNKNEHINDDYRVIYDCGNKVYKKNYI